MKTDKKKSISRQIEHTDRPNPNPRVKIGGRTHLGLGAPPTAGYRRTGKFCAAARRGAVKNRAAARRRDAGVHACGLQSEAPSTASSMAVRSPNGERARRRASRGGAALSSSAATMAIDAFTLAATAVVEREGGGKEMA